VVVQRFDASQENVRKLEYGMDYDRFRRIWRFYLLPLGKIFASCDGEYNGNGHYLLVHS
jgi:cyclopropane-fatty-acyl-phospholipid synthase